MNKKKNILICMSEVPYPVRRNGVSIRYLPILKHFCKIYEIDLLLILGNSDDEEHIGKLKKYTKNLNYFIRKKRKPGLLKKVLVHLSAYIPGRQPLEAYCYDEKQIKSYIKSKTHGMHYDVKLSVTLAFTEIIRDNVSADRYVIDCIDSVYAHLIREIKGTLINKYKLSLVRHWETKCISKADIASYVSPLDIKVLAGNHKIDNVEVMPNGIYIDDYSDEKNHIEGFVIGFLGNMDYHPNIQAALKLSDIFNSLKDDIAGLKLLIIGRNPSKEIVDLKKVSGVIVTGVVDTIWPYVNATDVFVFPMSHGSGQQNKLLDVMYASRPVISSSLGNSGVGAKKDLEVEIADTDDEVKAKIIELYKDANKKERLGKAGKSFIEKKYEWNNIFEKMDSSYFFKE